MNKKMILITHGDLGSSIIGVAASIIGADADGALSFISNAGLSTAELAENISEVIGNDTDCFYILATDFPGGSCFIASKKIASKSKHITTVSGLNISMVLSFLTKKDMFNGDRLAEVIRTDGNRAIVS
jgi:mannose/fructose-specific phosphotransferase system component IIA